MWLLLITILLILALSLLLFSLVSLLIATLSGAPFVPARKDRIMTVVELINPKPGMNIVDLGSGDGRVVRAIANRGARVDGYEIQILLVWWSNMVSRFKRLANTAFYRRNLFSVNLSKYNVVVVYGLPQMMHQLRQKFEAELKPGSRVVSIAFPIPGWVEIEKQNGVYMYTIQSAK